MPKRPSRASLLRTVLLSVLVAGAALTTGCTDTAIDPFDNDGNIYSVYGFLDLLEREHFVRVVEVSRLPERITDPNGPRSTIDATVTSTDLTSMETDRWSHSLEKLSDDTYAHIFSSRILLTPGRRYRLTVTRSDGEKTVAETQIPRLIEAHPADFGPLPNPSSPEPHLQTVTINGLASPWDITVIYHLQSLRTPPNSDGGKIVTRRRFEIKYGRSGQPAGSGGWAFDINYTRDATELHSRIDSLDQLGVFDRDPAKLLATSLRIRILDESWNPPGGVFDPEVLAQPNTLSNVKNGYGFWGSVGLVQQEMVSDPVHNELLGL